MGEETKREPEEALRIILPLYAFSRLQPAPSRKLSKHRSGLDAGIRGTQLEEEVLDWLRQAAALAALRGPGGRAPPAGASSVPLADGVSALL